MYLTKFYETEKEDRPECVCHYILPKDKVGRLGGGIVDIQPGGTSYSKAHTEWRQIFFILEGTGTLVLTGPEGKVTERRVQADMVAEIPFNSDHKVVADKGVRMRYLYINDFSQPLVK